MKLFNVSVVRRWMLDASRSFSSLLLIAMVACLLSPAALWAQEKEEEEKPKGPPDPEDLTLQARDNVVVKATYWEPEEADKNTVPIILIHGWGGKRQEYDLLGKYLQDLGHAAISVDLRGHGGSTTLRRPHAETDLEIDPNRMNKADFERMVYDVQAAKDYLFDKHVEGKLNLEQLCVVGADLGALVALNFAVYDWSRRVYPARIYKIGQDVKGLILLSPPQGEKGLSVTRALKHDVVRSKLSAMIVVGSQESRAYRDAKRLHSALERFHVKVPDDAPENVQAEKLDLFLVEPDTKLQGTKLLSRGLNVDRVIAEFINLRLVKKQDDFAWAERERPPQ